MERAINPDADLSTESAAIEPDVIKSPSELDDHQEESIAASTILPAPPDGGWGWVVVFASFMCNVIVDGIIFSFGILLLEISSTFRESKGITAWIGSLQAGCYLSVGE